MTEKEKHLDLFTSGVFKSLWMTFFDTFHKSDTSAAMCTAFS